MNILKWALVVLVVVLAVGFVLADDNVSIVHSTIIAAEPDARPRALVRLG
ncbi:MAG: hypothetical protein ACREXW_09845 [Gammaproteobacteria bacterium]